MTTPQKKQRLDICVAALFECTRSQAQHIIAAMRVTVNGTAVTKNGFLVGDNDRVLIHDAPGGTPEALIESPPDLTVVAESDDYLVINKPAGILTHPTERRERGTVADWILQNRPVCIGVGEHPDRPGIVHRLDKDASGLLVIAKTQAMYENLKRQFQERHVEKEYCVLVYGVIEADHETIDFPIDRGSDGHMVSRPKTGEITLKNIRHMQTGKPALTEFTVLQRFARFTLLSVKIHTGRTHQIRVHFFAYNHPVVGDMLYCNKKLIKKGDRDLGRLFLHAKRLCFEAGGQRISAEAPLPNMLVSFLDSLSPKL